MNPSINNCLEYIDGNESVYESLLADGEALKTDIASWNWDLPEALLEKILHLVLLTLITGDNEIKALKITALGQLSQLEISERQRDHFEHGLDEKLRPFSSEILNCFEEEDLSQLLPKEDNRPSNIVSFDRAKKSFVDSYYALAAHSGFDDETQSPIPVLSLEGGYVLSCAFPDPKNFCRLWFELRHEGKVADGVIGDLWIADQCLSLSSGECAALVSPDDLAALLEGELELRFEMKTKK